MTSEQLIFDRLNEYSLKREKYRDINCINTDLHSQALGKYKSFTKAQHDGILFGKIFAVKDNINVESSLMTCASNILKEHNSIYSSTAVEKIEDAGGLIVAKTNLDEFGMGSSNEHSIFGTARNPVNLDYVCGGSSGGSAGAVAAGIVDIALGSDTGGSVRQPASFCGVYGLKPTYGRISRNGLTAFASSFDQIGILSNKLDDLINTFQTISGADNKDSTTSKKPVAPFKYSNNQAKKIRIGIPKEYLDDSLSSDIKKEMSKMIQFFKKNNFEVLDISLPLTHKCISVYYILTTAEAASNLSRFDGVRYGTRESAIDINEMYMKTRSKGFGDEVKRRIILGTFILSSGYYEDFYSKALKVRRLIKEDFANAFKSVDIILTPTSPYTAFKIGEKIDNPVNMYLSDTFTVPMSLAGLPAMNFPSGKDHNGLPIGLQLTANQFEENTIFALTKFINNNYEG